MASKLMDERSMSPSSYFFQEICCPAERQVGFWDRETMVNHPGLGMDGFMRTSGSKTIPSLPLEKLAPLGAESIECLGITQPGLVRDQNAKLTHVVGAERATNLSMTPWKSVDNNLGTKSNIFGHPKSYFPESNNIDAGRQYESALFSSSFSDMFGKKLKLASKDVLFGQSIDFVAPHYDEGEPFDNLEEIEAQTIGDLLPDDDDLLSGMNGHLDYMAQPNSSDDIEDLDIFSSGGGMELEGDGSINSSWIQRISKNAGGISTGEPGGLKSSIVGEHPCSENPSRTLFVRNIISNIEDSELRSIFEQYGDIRTLYTDCKHRGFVMISYYDIRAASNAIRALKNRPLRRRKLDIHFSIPKDVSSENDINQGTLMVFNPDPSVSNHDLHKIFSVYGEVKEIRERADKHHHKYIEFYDIRALEAAHRALNRMDVSQKSIKLEPNHFGGARLRSVEQSYLELEQEEFSPCLRQGSPPTNSPSIGLGPVSNGAVTSSCKDAQALHSAIGIPINQFMENGFQHGFSPSVPQRLTSSIIGGQCGHQSGLGEMSHSLGQTEFGFQHMSNRHPHSLPDYHDGLANGVPYNSPSALAADTNPRPAEGFDNVHIHPVGSNRHSIGPIDSAIGSGNGNCTLRGHHYMWSPSNSYRPPPSYMMWMNPPSYVNGHPSPQLHRLPRVPSHMMNAAHLHRHQVGSAPAVNPSLWEKQLAYSGESHEISGFHPGSLGNTNFLGSPTHPSHNIFPHAGGNCMDPSVASTNVGLQSPQNRFHMVPRRNQVTHMPNPFDTSNERVRSRRIEVSSNQADNKKQYELDIDRILRREDIRTTLMIKNIPNKYTSKMLLAAIDEHHRGTYDFIYLPIDFKNKCNVGYAFINMIDPLQIVPFYQAFNGKKWEKFNSEKVATLAYARIQGKSALVAHFQNSSLMNEDKRCRPILFHTDGPNAGDQEPFPMGMNIRPRISKTRTNSSDENHQGSPSTSPNGEQSSTSIDSSSGSE